MCVFRRVVVEETEQGWTFGEFAALEEALKRRARALVAATMSARERIEERLSIFPVKMCGAAKLSAEIHLHVLLQAATHSPVCYA